MALHELLRQRPRARRRASRREPAGVPQGRGGRRGRARRPRRAEAAPAGIKAIGAEHVLLATDLGQTGNPSPPDGLKMLVSGLMAEGITRDQIRTMGREVPGRLLTG